MKNLEVIDYTYEMRPPVFFWQIGYLGLSERELYLLFYLYVHSYRTGRCEETRDELSENLNLRVQSVSETLKSLQEKRLIVPIQNPEHRQKRSWGLLPIRYWKWPGGHIPERVVRGTPPDWLEGRPDPDLDPVLEVFIKHENKPDPNLDPVHPKPDPNLDPVLQSKKVKRNTGKMLSALADPPDRSAPSGATAPFGSAAIASEVSGYGELGGERDGNARVIEECEGEGDRHGSDDLLDSDDDLFPLAKKEEEEEDPHPPPPPPPDDEDIILGRRPQQPVVGNKADVRARARAEKRQARLAKREEAAARVRPASSFEDHGPEAQAQRLALAQARARTAHQMGGRERAKIAASQAASAITDPTLAEASPLGLHGLYCGLLREAGLTVPSPIPDTKEMAMWSKWLRWIDAGGNQFDPRTYIADVLQNWKTIREKIFKFKDLTHPPITVLVSHENTVQFLNLQKEIGPQKRMSVREMMELV